MSKPEALRLADALMTLFPSREDGERAAAELRRLHEENELLASAADKIRLFWRNEVHRLLAQREALLAVVNKLEYRSDGCIKRYPEESEVNAVIAKTEGQ